MANVETEFTALLRRQARSHLGTASASFDQAADEIDRLRAAMAEACDLLMEKTHGNPARSAGHNARLRLQAALQPLT